MINHLILLSEEQDLHVTDGKLISGHRKIAIEYAGQHPVFLRRLPLVADGVGIARQRNARWSCRAGTSSKRNGRRFSLAPRARYVNPTALWKLCRLSPQRATQLASGLLVDESLQPAPNASHAFDPRLADKPQLQGKFLQPHSAAGSQLRPVLLAALFCRVGFRLFEREKRKATHPINAALNYGYGFLYHAIEWQCLASGLDPTVGIIHKLRRSRPSLACDLIEPLRCTVELTVVRHLDDLQEPKRLAGHFAEMFETPFSYRDGKFKLRSIIRLMVESFVRALGRQGSFSTFCAPCS